MYPGNDKNNDDDVHCNDDADEDDNHDIYIYAVCMVRKKIGVRSQSVDKRTHTHRRTPKYALSNMSKRFIISSFGGYNTFKRNTSTSCKSVLSTL